MALDKRIINSTFDRLYVGTPNGVFRLDNPTQDFGGGAPTWIEIGLASNGSRTLPNAAVSTLALNTTTGILAAATYGRGVYEIQIRGLVRGRVFEDFNGNGVLDPGDPPFVNFSVIANNQTTSEAFATATDDQGFYEFRSLTPGTYSITVLRRGEFVPNDGRQWFARYQRADDFRWCEPVEHRLVHAGLDQRLQIRRQEQQRYPRHGFSRRAGTGPPGIHDLHRSQRQQHARSGRAGHRLGRQWHLQLQLEQRQ